ncbi:MAG: glycerophosphodiester phosphodiesterase [Clostridiales bacterium]|nr:glycerophosphodiester phosphodiesterase [Clostridiales bacterium]
MKEYWKLYKESFDILKKNYQKFLGYMIVANLVLVVLLIPFTKGIFNFIMKTKGLDYITNGLLKKFIVSPQGISVVLISLIVGSIVILLEIGGVIVLSHQSMVGAKESRFVDIFRYTLTKLKYLFSLDGLIIVIYFIIIAPMLDKNLKASIFTQLKIPGFIMTVIESNIFYFTSLIICTLLALYLAFRWMFSLHVLLLDGQNNKKFLKASSRLIKKNFKEVLKFGFFTLIIEVIILTISFVVYFIVSILLIAFLPLNFEFSIIFVLSIGMGLILIASTLSSSMNIIRMTQLYYRISEYDIVEIEVKTVEEHTMFNRFLNNKWVVGIAVVVVVVVANIYIYLLYEGFDTVKYDVEITAHRGSSFEAPENTLSALKKAMLNGADYAEIDIQLTNDNQIILLHDETFERTTGSANRPDELSLAEIKSLDAGAWFSSEFTDEKIPTLQEVIDLSKGKLKLNIEVKGSKYSPNIINELIKVIEYNNYSDSCVITSLRYEDLEAIESLKPDFKTGYIMFVAIGDIEKLNVDFYSVEETNVTEAFVSKAHSSGREVHVWTINDEASMGNILDLGVDNIITDYDALLKNLIKDN